MAIYRSLTKEDFCQEVHMSPTNWVFNGDGPNPGFWKYDGEYYYDNDAGVVRKYKDMPLYEEIWVAVRHYDEEGPDKGWGLWSTWKQY